MFSPYVWYNVALGSAGLFVLVLLWLARERRRAKGNEKNAGTWRARSPSSRRTNG
jgi:hypothetical protein